MGFIIREIKKDEIKKGNGYSLLWEEAVRVLQWSFGDYMGITDERLLRFCDMYARCYGEYYGNGVETWWIAVEDGDVVGVAETKVNGKKYCYVDQIGVIPEKRNKGYGRELINFLSKKYIKIELKSIADEFYKKCGFTKEDILNKKKNSCATMFKITPPTDDNDISRHKTEKLKHSTLEKLNEGDKIKKSKDDIDRSKLKKFDKDKREWQKPSRKFNKDKRKWRKKPLKFFV